MLFENENRHWQCRCNVFLSRMFAMLWLHVFSIIKSAYDRFTQQSNHANAPKLTDCGVECESVALVEFQRLFTLEIHAWFW